MNFKTNFLSKSPFLKPKPKKGKTNKKTKKYYKENKNKFMCGPGGCKEGEVEVEEVEVFEKRGRCWPGYKPTPGKEAYSDGSCKPV